MKQCFKACHEHKIKQGLCECHNEFKEKQRRLITEIMQEDEKNGLYDEPNK